MPSDLIYREDAKDYARHAIAKGLNVLEYLDEVPAANFRPVVRGNLMYDELVNRLRETPSDWPDAELHYEAADAIEKLSGEQKKGKWIPVTERLPEPGIDVLVKQTFSYPYVTHGWRTATYWEWVAYPSDHKKKNPTSFSSICPGNEFVTHWMPLPSAPTEE